MTEPAKSEASKQLDTRKLLRAALLTGSAGGGAAFLYFALSVAKQEPRAVVELVSRWGPVAFVAILAILLVDRRIGDMLAVNREATIAQQRAADAVQQQAEAMERIAARDQERDREIDLVIGQHARHSREISRQFSGIARALNDLSCRRLQQISAECPSPGSPDHYFRAPLDVPVSIRTEQGEELRARSVNLSGGGMAVGGIGNPAKCAGDLELSFELPAGGKVEAAGQVCWADVQGRAGIRFTRIDPALITDLQQWLAEQQEKHCAVAEAHAENN